MPGSSGRDSRSSGPPDRRASCCNPPDAAHGLHAGDQRRERRRGRHRNLPAALAQLCGRWKRFARPAIHDRGLPADGLAALPDSLDVSMRFERDEDVLQDVAGYLKVFDDSAQRRVPPAFQGFEH
ncbi:protein of unknown function (plasmid) [Caballeronia sp. S22]